MPKVNVIQWDDTANWKSWSLSDFVAWHRGLVRHFGNKKDEKGILFSDKYWLIFWAASEGYNEKLKYIVAAPSAFEDEIEYLKEASPKIYEMSQIKQAVEIGRLSPVDVIYNAVGTTVEAANDIIGGLGTTAKVLGYIIPVMAVTALVFLFIWGYKKFIVKKA